MNSYLLATSSLFMMIPAIIEITNSLYILGILTGTCSFCSAIMWLDYDNNTKRFLDRSLSRITIVLYTIIYIYYDIVDGLLHFTTTYFLYKMSCIMYESGHKIWIVFHFIFHFFSLYTQLKLVNKYLLPAY